LYEDKEDSGKKRQAVGGCDALNAHCAPRRGRYAS
jgi:hypothetical protein